MYRRQFRVSTRRPHCITDMSKLPKILASQIDWTILKIFALVTISYVMLWAAFSMIVQMGTEMDALEVSASIAGRQRPIDREAPSSPTHDRREAGFEGYVGQATFARYSAR